jgi:hypothetical protein
MSQAGDIDVTGSHPEIPTEFVADVGSAIQFASESALSDATVVGFAAFDSAAFNVDANGFVTLLGGGAAATNIDVDANTPPGTDPVVPNGSGNITLTGAQVASGVVGANVIRTDSLAANTVTIEIQRTTTAAAADSTKNGVAHFDSATFAVDGNGFVTLAGGSLAIDSIGVDATSGGGTNPVLPTVAGLVTNNGAVVAAGTNPVRTVSTAANVYQTQLQISQALAATDATKIGLANFDSASFAVDANGFVTLVHPSCQCVTLTGDMTLAVNTCYITNFAEIANLTLPATASLCDEISITYGLQGVSSIQQNAGQQIRFGVLATTVGVTGSLQSTSIGDCIRLKCVVAGSNTLWTVVSSIGNWIVT